MDQPLFERKLEGELQRWLTENSAEQPLLVKGARRVGKTHLVEHMEGLGELRLVKLDFQAEDALAAQVFAGPTDDLDRITRALSEYKGIDIRRESALLFFDEVQLNERALNSLRFFAGSGWHVIATGSLLGVAVRQRKLPFPSDVEQLTLHPMDFEEFLWALGEEPMADAIRAHFETGEPYILHERALDFYRHFLVVGGMPRVVGEYVQSGQLDRVARRQAEIDETYVADMTDPDNGINGIAAKHIWESITSQLLRSSTKKFKYSEVERGGRREKLLEPLEWLEAAGIVTRNSLTRDTCAPLTPYGEEEGSFFKLYAADTGIMFHKFGLAAQTYLDATSRELLSSDFRGALAENYVMQALTANEARTFYWMPEQNASRGEIGFVIQERNGEVVPVEVKSGRNVAAKSLKAFIKSARCERAYRFSELGFGVSAIEGTGCELCGVPLYAAFCLGCEMGT